MIGISITDTIIKKDQEIVDEANPQKYESVREVTSSFTLVEIDRQIANLEARLSNLNAIREKTLKVK